jgi:hypothetical protein
VTTGEIPKAGAAPPPGEHDPGLPVVIIDLSGRDPVSPAAPTVRIETIRVEPITVPIIEPLTEPIFEPGTVPILEPGTVPIFEPGTVPILEPGTVPILKPGTVPILEPGTVPVAEQADPVDSVIEPIARTAVGVAPVRSAVPRHIGRVLGRARVYPRRRRRSPAVVGHRRRWRRSSVRTWEAVAWLAAVGVVATMAGFVVRSIPRPHSIVASGPSAAAVAAAPRSSPKGASCFIVACFRTFPDGPPTRVRIPSIDVDSTLESLSLGAHQQLNPPSRYDEAGWWRGGAVPGDPGLAVIAGHVDSTRGPGVFFRLRDVTPGESVSVQRGGVWVKFRVTRVERYPKDKFPTDKVYSPVTGAELRVITCGGDFDTVHGTYYDNIVVYAILVT